MADASNTPGAPGALGVKRCPYCNEAAARQGRYIVCTLCERVLGEAPPIDWTNPKGDPDATQHRT